MEVGSKLPEYPVPELLEIGIILPFPSGRPRDGSRQLVASLDHHHALGVTRGGGGFVVHGKAGRTRKFRKLKNPKVGMEELRMWTLIIWSMLCTAVSPDCPAGDYYVHGMFPTRSLCLQKLAAWELSAEDHRGVCYIKSMRT